MVAWRLPCEEQSWFVIGTSGSWAPNEYSFAVCRWGKMIPKYAHSDAKLKVRKLLFLFIQAVLTGFSAFRVSEQQH